MIQPPVLKIDFKIEMFGNFWINSDIPTSIVIWALPKGNYIVHVCPFHTSSFCCMIVPIWAVTINNASIKVRDPITHPTTSMMLISRGLHGSGSFLVFIAKLTQFGLLALMMLPLLSMTNLLILIMSTMTITYRDLWDFRPVIFPCFCCEIILIGAFGVNDASFWCLWPTCSPRWCQWGLWLLPVVFRIPAVIFPCFCCEMDLIWGCWCWMHILCCLWQPFHLDNVKNDDDNDFHRFIGFRRCDLSMFLLRNGPNSGRWHWLHSL